MSCEVPFGLRRLWDQLAEEPSLASAVESLEIQRDDGPRYAKPHSLQVPRDYMKEAEEMLQDYHIISDANAVQHLRDIEKVTYPRYATYVQSEEIQVGSCSAFNRCTI